MRASSMFLVVWEYVMLLADKLIGHIVPVRFAFFMMIGGLEAARQPSRALDRVDARSAICRSPNRSNSNRDDFKFFTE